MKQRKDQMFVPNENYRLEDRVLFEAAAAEVAAAADQMAEQTAEQAAAESAADSAENFDTESLEGNFAESAAALDSIAPDGVNDVIPAELPETESMTIDLLGNGDTALSAGRELVIVNSTVMGKDSILNTLAPHQEVLILDGESDAMAQIQSYLDSADGKFDALHFVTHGNDGYFRLGDEVCNSENFNAADWQAIGSHLTQDGDILIYGCDLAETAAGKDFAAMIAEASGADVAASTDTTGAGGNWDLEFRTGTVETAAVSAGDYGYSLASGKVLLVNGDTAVAYDTIQEAITAATDTEAEYIIKFDSALFTDEADLVFTESLQTKKADVNITIDGSLGELDLDNDGEADRVILDGEESRRLLQISQGNISMTLKNLVFRDGYYAGNGGAVYSDQAGTLTIENVDFINNDATASGGAVYYFKGDLVFRGTNNITGSSVVSDRTVPTSGYGNINGAAIYSGISLTVESGALNVKNASVDIYTELAPASHANYSGGFVVKASKFTVAEGASFSMTGADVAIERNTSGSSNLAVNTGLISIHTLTLEKDSAFQIGGNNAADGNKLSVITTDGVTHTINGGMLDVSFAATATDANILIANNNVISAGGNAATNIYGGMLKLGGNGTTPEAGRIHSFTGGTLKITDNSIVMTGNGNRTIGGAAIGHFGDSAYIDLTLTGEKAADGSNTYLFSGNDVTFTEGGGTSAAVNGGEIFLWNRGNASISNVTFEAGNVKGFTKGDGGAIRVGDNTNLMLNHVNFSGYSSGNGGAVYSGGIKLTITDSILSGNTATGSGGAVYHNDGSGTLLLDGVTFSGNEAKDGGAVYASSAITLNNTEFEDNTATNAGGALYNTKNISASGTVLIENNSAKNGGGIYYTGTAGVTFSGMTFTGNTAADSGGALYITKALSIAGNTFTNNEAEIKGGAVFTSADLTVAGGNTFTGNKVLSGGTTGAQSLIGGGAIAGSKILFQGENNFTGNGVGKDGVLANSSGQGGVIRGSTITVDAGAVLNIKDSSIILRLSTLGYTKGTHFDVFSGGVIYASALNMNGTESSRAVLKITNTEMIAAPGEKIETDTVNSQYNLNGGAIYATKANTAYADIQIDRLSVTISNKGDTQYRKMASLAGAGLYLADGSTFDHTNMTFQNIHATAEASAAVANTATVRGMLFFASKMTTHTGKNSNFVFKDNSATALSESGSTAAVYGAGISTMNHDVQTIDFSENNTFLFENNQLYAETSGTISTGGADIYITGQKKTVLISNATFIAATNANHNAVTGGSVYADGYSFTLTNASFTGYSASGNGGTIYASFSNAPKQLTLDHVTIKDSAANQGGAIFINAAENAVFSHLTVENASAVNGGAIYHNTGNLEISNSTFTGITATGNNGAGIYFASDSKTMALVNVTLLMRDGDYGVYYNKDNATAYVLNSILLGASKGDLRYNGTKQYVFGTLLGKASVKTALDVTAASKNAADAAATDIFGTNQLVYIETEGFGTNGGGVIKMDADSAYKTYGVYTAKISDGSGYYYHDGSAWKNAGGGAYDAAKSVPYSVSQGGAARSESNVISGAYNQTAAAEKLSADIVVNSTDMNFIYGDYGTADGNTLEFIHSAGVFDIVYTVTVAFSSTSAAGMYKAGTYEITGVAFKEVRSGGVAMEQAEVDKYFSSITVSEGEGGNAKFTLAKQNIKVSADRLEIVAGKTPEFTYSVLGQGLEAGDSLSLVYSVTDAAGDTVDHTKGETFSTVGDVFQISVSEGADTEAFDNENYLFEFVSSTSSTITVQDAVKSYIVTTGEDVSSKTDGLLSLREAIVEVNASRNRDQVITIHFADSITGDVLLKSGLDITSKAQIVIDGQKVTVDGDGNITATSSDEITLTRSGGHGMKIFNGSNVTYKNMTVDGRVTNADAAMFQSSVTESASLQLDNVDIIDMRKGFDVNYVDVSIKNNSTISNGGVGATYNVLLTVKNGSLTIADTTISGNKNSTLFAVTNSDVSVSDSVISDNAATANTLFSITNGSLSITDTEISGNLATGTAVNMNGSDLSVTGTVFTGNASHTLISVTNGDSELTNATFRGNTGKTSLLNTNNGDLTIADSIFEDNGTDAMKAINMAGMGKLTITSTDTGDAYSTRFTDSRGTKLTVPLISLTGSVSAEITAKFHNLNSIQSDANGAVFFSKSTESVVIKDSMFTDIVTTSSSARKGWVKGLVNIDNTAASLTVMDSTFRNNSISGSYRECVQGGIIFANADNVEITGSVFENNTITESSVINILGGVISHISNNAGSSTIIADTVFSGNNITVKNIVKDVTVSGSQIYSNAENLTVTGTKTDVEFKNNLIDLTFSTAKKFTMKGQIYHDDSIGTLTLTDLTFDGVTDAGGKYITSVNVSNPATVDVSGQIIFGYNRYTDIDGLTIQNQEFDQSNATGAVTWNGMIRLNRPSLGLLPAGNEYDFSLTELTIKDNSVNLEITNANNLTVNGGLVGFTDLRLADGSVQIDGAVIRGNTFTAESQRLIYFYGGFFDFGNNTVGDGYDVEVTVKDINAKSNAINLTSHVNNVVVQGIYVRDGMRNSTFNLLGTNTFESNSFSAEIGIGAGSDFISDIQGAFHLGGGGENGSIINIGSSTDGGSLNFIKETFTIKNAAGIVHSYGGVGLFINGGKLTSYADISYDSLTVNMEINLPSWYGYRYDVAGLLLMTENSELTFHKSFTVKNIDVSVKKTGDVAALAAANKMGYRVRGGLISYNRSALDFRSGLTMSGNDLVFKNDLGGKIDVQGGLIGYDSNNPSDFNSFKVNDGGLAVSDNTIILSGINNDTVESAGGDRFLVAEGGLMYFTGDVQFRNAAISGNTLTLAKTGEGNYENRLNGGLIYWHNDNNTFTKAHLFDISGTVMENNTVVMSSASSQLVNGGLVYIGKQRFENSADLTNLRITGNTLKTADTGFSGTGKFTVNGGLFQFEQRNDNNKFTADMSGSIFRDNGIVATVNSGTFAVQGGVILFWGQNVASDSLILNNVYADGKDGNQITLADGLSSTFNGGFLFADGGSIVIENAMFTGNSAVSGGAFHVSNGAMTVADSRFTGNSAVSGGAVYLNKVSGGMENVVMYGNTATEDGGAIYFNTGDASFRFSIVNSTIVENSSGIYLRYAAAPLTILNSIVAWNDTSYDLTTHIYQPATYANLVIGNSIFTSADKVLKSLALDDTSKFAENLPNAVYKLNENKTYGEGTDTVTVSTAAYLILQSGAAAGGVLVYKDNGTYNTAGTGTAVSTDINGMERTSPYVMGADARTVQTVDHVIAEQTGATYGDADLKWAENRTFGGSQEIKLNDSLTVSAWMNYTLTYGEEDKSSAGYMNASPDGYAITGAALNTDVALTGAAYENGLISVTENNVKTYFLVTLKLADSGAKYVIAKRALDTGNVVWSGGKYTGNTYNSADQFNSIKGTAELTSDQLLAGDTVKITIASGSSNFTDAGTHTAVISCTDGNYTIADAHTITGLTKDYVIDKAKITLTPAVASGETIKVDTNYISVAQDKLDGFSFKCTVAGDTFDDDLNFRMIAKDGTDFEVSKDTAPAVYEVRYVIDGSPAGNYEVTNADVYTRFIVVGTGKLSPDLSNQTVSIGTYGDYTSVNNTFATTVDTGDQFGLELTYTLYLNGETLNTATNAYNAGTFSVNSAVLDSVKVDAGYTAEIRDGRIIISSKGDAVMIYNLDALKINGFQAKIDALVLNGTITWKDNRTDAAKVYNGSTHSGGVTATVSADNAVSGDTFDFSCVYSSDKGDTEFIHAGTHTGSLVNNDSNYDFSALTWTAGTDKFVITPKVLTITGGITAQDRDYDGTTDAVINKYTVSNADGKVGSDELYVEATGKFAAKDVVKDGKQTVNIETLTLSGKSAGDYLLAESGHQSTTAAEIRAIDVTISGITAADRVYDGTANAEAVTGNAVFTGKIGSDELTVSADGTFADKNIGTKDVTFSSLVLGGKDAVNYRIASWNKTTAAITPKALSITVSDQADVVYGTAVTPVYTYDGLCSGDSFTGELAIDGTRSTSGNLTAGIHNIIQNTLWINDGNGGSNYTVTFTGDSFKVTPKDVAVSGITAENKVYDGTTDVTLVFDNAAFDGLVSGDLLGTTADGEFASQDAAADITVTLFNMLLTGADKDNYAVKDGSQTETAASIEALTVKAVWVLKDSYVASNEDQSKDVKAYYLDINGDKVKLNITITRNGVKVPFREAGTYLARGIVQDTNYVLDVKTETKKLVMDEAPMNVNADTPIDPSNPNYSSRYHAMMNSAIGQYQDAVLMQTWNSNYDFYLMASTSPIDRLMEMMYSMPVKVDGIHGGSYHHGGSGSMGSVLSSMSGEFDDNHGLRAALGEKAGGISELTLDDEYHFNFFRQIEQEEETQMQADASDIDFSMNDMLDLIVKSDKFKDEVDEAIEAMMTVTV